MTSAIRLLATVSIVALAITVAAPAAKATKAVAPAAAAPAKTVKGVAHSSSHKAPRRGKRSVIVQVPVEIDDDAVEDTELEQELSMLSDSQLEILAGIVQQELERYDPNQEEYEIVDIPVEYLQPQQRAYPRDRRSLPVIDDEDAGEEEEEQLVFVPQEVLEEALAEQAAEQEAATKLELVKELDELELRVRIGEMADILNERASRNAARR